MNIIRKIKFEYIYIYKKNNNMYFNEKIDLYCIIFETNKYIYRMVICVVVECKSNSRQGKA